MNKNMMIKAAVRWFDSFYGRKAIRIDSDATVTEICDTIHPERVARVSFPAIIGMKEITFNYVVKDDAKCISFERQQELIAAYAAN